MNADEIREENKQFDANGRCIPNNINSPVNIETRRYKKCHPIGIPYIYIP